MNLYTLQKEIKEKHLYQTLLLEKICLLRTRLEPKSSDASKEICSGGVGIDIADIVHQIVELEKELKQIESEICLYKPILSELERLLKEYNEIPKLMYFEYYVKGYSADNIGIRHSYSRAQVYNIINKLDQELKAELIK